MLRHSIVHEQVNFDCAKLHASLVHNIAISLFSDGGQLSDPICFGIPKCENSSNSALNVDLAVNIINEIALV